jgi:hypothetical protein
MHFCILFLLFYFSSIFTHNSIFSCYRLSSCHAAHICTIDDFLKLGTFLSPELEQLTLPESKEGGSILSVCNWCTPFILFLINFLTQFNIILVSSSVLLSYCHIDTIDDFLNYVTLLSLELEQLTLPECAEGGSPCNPVIGSSF